MPSDDFTVKIVEVFDEDTTERSVIAELSLAELGVLPRYGCSERIRRPARGGPGDRRHVQP
jgi:hypothetical protein